MTDAYKPIIRIADLFVLPPRHRDALPTGITAPLRRTAPEQLLTRYAELLPVLLSAGVTETELRDTETVRRWAVLVHFIAVLAGTTQDRAHGSKPIGAGLHEAGYSEARLSKLLTARGSGLRDQAARLARFLRAKGAMPLDLVPLAELVLWEGRDKARAENARLSIARSYYTAADKAERAVREETE